MNQFSAVAATAAAVVSAVDPTALALGTVASAKAMQKFSTEKEFSIENLKSNLTKLLGEIAKIDPTFRVLVTIDDLDRLEPNEILEVIRLVKAVADFPATFYLLAYDRNIVADAVQNSVKIKDGYSYLEKIIQFSFKVPPLEPFKLRSWLRSELAIQFPEEIHFGSHRAQIIIDRWGGRLLRTPRDVRRLLLSIQLIWPHIKGEVDFLDLIWLQLIKEKASSKNADLYSWVCSYLQSLDAVAIGGSVTGKIDNQTELETILSDIGWKNFELENKNSFDFDMHNLDQILVGITHSYLGEPKQNNELWTYKFNDKDINKAIEDKRLSSPRHWRNYFALELPSHAMTDEEWFSLVEASKKSIPELTKRIKSLLERSKSLRIDIGDQIVERLLYGIRSSALPNPNYWLLAIAKLSEDFEKRSKSDGMFGFGMQYEYSSNELVREIVSACKGLKRQKLLKSLFVEFGSTCLVSRVIRDQIYWKNETGHNVDKNLYLTAAEIKKCSKTLSGKYSKITPKELLGLHNPWDLLYAWKVISGNFKAPKELIKNCVSTDEGLISTLKSLRKVSSTTHNGIPHLRVNELKNFIAPKTVKNRLEKIAGSNSILSTQAANLLNVWDDGRY